MDLSRIPLCSYAAIRPWLATGTVILWRGDDLLGRTIRLFTEFSHASLAVRGLDPSDAERVFLVEALATGLELRILSERVRGYRGRVFAWRPASLPEDVQRRVKSFALKECGRGVPYDYAGLFANMLGHVSEGWRRFFCSEFAAKALEQAGIARRPRYRNGYAARPGDIPAWFAGSIREIGAPR
jgi:hypothetical protein